MLMLDLCSGLGGASAAMLERGWDVVRIDNNPEFNPDIVADIRNWSWTGDRPDLIWASPPCVEFARESMPWSRTGNEPDMSIVKACIRIIEEANPRFWILENVRGAIKYISPLLGEPAHKQSPYFLWGHFPSIGRPTISKRKKESMSSSWRAERAKIPYELSLAAAVAIESQYSLFDFAPAWIECPYCEDYWCIIHGKHAHDCDCPSVEECEAQGWNPYLGQPNKF